MDISALLQLKLFSLCCASFGVVSIWYNLRLYNQASKGECVDRDSCVAANVGGVTIPKVITTKFMELCSLRPFTHSVFSRLITRQ